jgi:LacI family transcriptional regulator
VSIDNFGGARRLARALAGHGYRRFAVIRGADALRTSRDRHSGFVAGLRDAGLDLEDGFVVEADSPARAGTPPPASSPHVPASGRSNSSSRSTT